MNRPLIALSFGVVFLASSAFAFGSKEGCGGGQCKDCHTLTKSSAAGYLAPLGPNIIVHEVELSQIPGLWNIIITRPDGLNALVYMDFGHRYLIQGEAIEMKTKENVTRNKMIELNRIDFSLIPLDDALVLGDRNARHKVVVFDDPECSFCQKLQPEMKAVVKKRPDIAFFIKLMPLKTNTKAYDKAKTIICEKSIELLEKSLRGENLPAPNCRTDQIEKNVELAKNIRVQATPTLVYPDGRVIMGYKPADKIIELLDADLTVKGAIKDLPPKPIKK